MDSLFFFVGMGNRNPYQDAMELLWAYLALISNTLYVNALFT